MRLFSNWFMDRVFDRFLHACLENGYRTARELRPYQRAEEAMQKRRLADGRLLPQAAVAESGDMLFAQRYLFTYLVHIVSLEYKTGKKNINRIG